MKQKSIRILIVEDDLDFAEALVEVLDVSGDEIVCASSGEEAVTLCAQEVFDLYLVDIRLPGQNGVETLNAIRRGAPNATAVMMTGYVIQRMIAKAKAAGVLAVMHKPFDMRRLLELVEKVRSRAVVLIADDDADFRESIRDVVEEQEYRARVAIDGREAVERVVAGGIDCMLLDLQMPRLDGLQVCRELKAQDRLIPIIVMTAYPSQFVQAIKELRKLAVTDLLFKPVDPDKLLAALKLLTVP